MKKFKDLVQGDFAFLRHVVHKAVSCYSSDELPISDVRYANLYSVVCEKIDVETLRFDEGTRTFLKKLALVACSKISRDTAYCDFVIDVLKTVQAKEVFQ